MKQFNVRAVAFALVTGWAVAAWARGGGGCFLPDTPILLADGRRLPIREVQPGDQLLAFSADGGVVPATVRNVLRHEVDEYLELATGQMVLRVTPEHPFYVGAGTFQTLGALQVGDQIFAYDGHGLTAQPIVSLTRVRARTTVYNLQTDTPNTFFANGVAVHNKGGGCFRAGTRIRTPSGEVAIEQVRPGDRVWAVTDRGRRVPTTVEATFTTRAPLLLLETDYGTLGTTDEHPLRRAGGGFCRAGQLGIGDRLLVDVAGHLRWATVAESRSGVPPLSRVDVGGQPRWATVCDRRVVGRDAVPGVRAGAGSPSMIQEPASRAVDPVVFNLRVGYPHTFIADGFVVHNKGGFGGGGFHGGGYHGGGYHGRGGPNDNVVTFLVFAIVIVVVLVKVAGAINAGREDEDLDFVYSPTAVARKADKTEKLLEFIARVDGGWAAGTLRQVATERFVKLQECWEAREYGPMEPLLMPDLYAAHCAQLQGLRRNHEINRIEDLRVDRVDLVNVRYTNRESDREFTALISAQARDYYVDDRSGDFLRGDQEPARFQEFWTFQWHDQAWRLREIEQSRESDKLKEENFFETFTDQGVQQVYGSAGAQTGPAGPWLDQETEAKATRTERLLNFLVQTDKLWDRQGMLERARQVFLRVMLAQENGDPAGVPAADLFPTVATDLGETLKQWRAAGTTVEYRNLCVRKVELVLVRNFADNTRDEFTVRISAHAQHVFKQNGQVIQQDQYVQPFESYWTFGRLDGQWKLKEVLPPARGEQAIGQENTDEDSTATQLQWYYQHPRAG